MVYPRRFVRIHPLFTTVRNTRPNIANNTRIDCNKFSPVPTSMSPEVAMHQHSHGNGRPIKMSKMLLPIELETAISPCPCRATITDVKRSGTLVPAAMNVIPITCEGIFQHYATTVAHQTIKNEKIPSHIIEPMNVRP